MEPFDRNRVKRLFSRYLGGDKAGWADAFLEALDDPSLVFIRFEPETVVVRDQSYRVTAPPTPSDGERQHTK